MMNKDLVFGWVGSLFLHASLLFLMTYKLAYNPIITPVMPVNIEAQIIKAKAVDAKLIQAEIQKIQQHELQQKSQKQIQQTNINKKLDQLKQEQKKLQIEKNNLNKIKKQAEIEKANLAKSITEHKKILAQEAAAREAIRQEKLNQIKHQRILNLVEQSKAKIKAQIEEYKQYLLHLPDTLHTEITFFLLPDGQIQNVRISRSSGNPNYDQSALIAVQRAQPFPMPAEIEAVKQLNREITIGLKNDYAST